MHDLIIMVGTALCGGLYLNLQKSMVVRSRIKAGTLLLAAGWIMLLIFSRSGPFPFDNGAAVGCGLLLSGIMLLTPAVGQILQIGRRTDGDSRI